MQIIRVTQSYRLDNQAEYGQERDMSLNQRKHSQVRQCPCYWTNVTLKWTKSELYIYIAS